MFTHDGHKHTNDCILIFSGFPSSCASLKKLKQCWCHYLHFLEQFLPGKLLQAAAVFVVENGDSFIGAKCASSCRKLLPKPFTMKICIVRSLRHFLAKAQRLPLANGLQILLCLGVMTQISVCFCKTT